MEELRNKAKQLDIILSDRQVEQFRQYYEFLIETNRVMNLTAITEYSEVIEKHFLDSILLGSVYDLQRTMSVIDVGSGAGFPGIPLKIVYPDLNITLLDSLNKRIGFLNRVIEMLQLKGITAIHMRAEDAGRNPKYRDSYDLCVSRAVANLATLSEYCLPFVKTDGYFISYKSNRIEEELSQAEHAIQVLGGHLAETKVLSIPDSEIERQFVMICKDRNTPKAYPRKAGTASKEPLHP